MAKVPVIPPLSSVSDPNTRSVLQAMQDQQRVRSGEVGDGTQKYLTIEDLTTGIDEAASLTASTSSRNMFAVGTKKGVSVATVIKKLSDSVMQSRIWKLLEERITWIERPEWFNAKFKTAVTVETTQRQDADRALANQVTTVFANLNGNIAGVREELTATITAQEALATHVTTLATDFNNNYALTQQKLTTLSNATSATASSVTQLQTEVGGVRNVAQQALSLTQDIEGKVEGTWSVKFDVNGYVAGVALGVDQQPGSPPKSNFVVRADMFAVGSPGVQDVVPFMVSGGIVYINKAMIGAAAIDTLKLAGSTVTVPQSATMSTGVIALGTDISDTGGFSISEGTLVGTFTTPAPPDVVNNLIVVTGRTGFLGGDNTAAGFRFGLFRSSDGLRIWDSGWAPFISVGVAGSVFDTAYSSRTYTLRVKGRGYDTGSIAASANVAITVLGGKR